MTAQADITRRVGQIPAACDEPADGRLAEPLPGEPCFPLGPLLEFAGLPSPTSLARRYGISGSTVKRWREHGIPMGVADDFAVLRLGVPAEAIWRDDWWLAGLDADRGAA